MEQAKAAVRLLRGEKLLEPQNWLSNLSAS